MEKLPGSVVEKTSWKILDREKFFTSNIPFIRNMGGLHKGKLHVLMSGTHAGKSTMVRTIVVDLVNNIKKDEKVLVWLSGESVSDFMSQISHAEYNTSYSDNVCFDSEIPDEGTRGPRENYMILEEYMQSGCYDVIIFDNITTSGFYTELKPGKQGSLVRHFKNLAKNRNFALITVAHSATGSSLSGKLLSPDDIKYSRQVSNLSEFFWIIQKFTVGESYHSFLFVEKHRGVETQDKIFFLSFSKENRVFKSIQKVTFDDFKESYSKRNKL